MNDPSSPQEPDDNPDGQADSIGGPVVIPTRAVVVVAVAAFVGAAAGAAAVGSM